VSFDYLSPTQKHTFTKKNTEWLLVIRSHSQLSYHLTAANGNHRLSLSFEHQSSDKHLIDTLDKHTFSLYKTWQHVNCQLTLCEAKATIANQCHTNIVELFSPDHQIGCHDVSCNANSRFEPFGHHHG
jgi:hypothetical protein